MLLLRFVLFDVVACGYFATRFNSIRDLSKRYIHFEVFLKRYFGFHSTHGVRPARPVRPAAEIHVGNFPLLFKHATRKMPCSLARLAKPASP